MLDLNSAWVQLKILLLDSLQRCAWKKFWGTSSGWLFQIPSDRISHRIHNVRTYCSQLLAWSRIFCFHFEVVCWLWGSKFLYPTMNLAFFRIIIIKIKFLAKFCLHCFDWFYLHISDTKYFPPLSKALWSFINNCYSILFSNLKQRTQHYY